MSAHSLPMNLDRALRNKFFRVDDPGASGTFYIDSKGHGIAEVVTATAESRALPAAVGQPVGARLLVILKTDGGDLTITGAGAGSVVMDTVGDAVEFVNVDVNGTNTWKVSPRSTAERQRVSSAITSGSIEPTYLRLTMTADGTATGNALRAFTNVNANIANARGAHISLSYSAVAGGSETSGLGTALTCTTHIPDVAWWAPTGTVYGALVELFSDGAASDPAGLTELAVLCLSNSGNATGKADVDTDASLIAINGFTAASGTTNVISSTSLVLDTGELPTNVGLRVSIDGADYYIPAFAAADWN